MGKIKIAGVSYEINQDQNKRLIELLGKYKKTSIVEFKSFDLVQIIIGGIVYELTKAIFNNYKEMIFDIINS